MLYLEFTAEPLPIAYDLFEERIPILFLKGMAFLHTTITTHGKMPTMLNFRIQLARQA